MNSEWKRGQTWPWSSELVSNRVWSAQQNRVQELTFRNQNAMRLAQTFHKAKLTVNHQYYLSLLSLETTKVPSSSLFRLTLHYEKVSHSLRQELDARIAVSAPFSMLQVISIAFSILNCLNHLQQLGKSICVNADNVWFNDEGRIKLSGQLISKENQKIGIISLLSQVCSIPPSPCDSPLQDRWQLILNQLRTPSYSLRQAQKDVLVLGKQIKARMQPVKKAKTQRASKGECTDRKLNLSIVQVLNTSYQPQVPESNKACLNVKKIIKSRKQGLKPDLCDIPASKDFPCQFSQNQLFDQNQQVELSSDGIFQSFRPSDTTLTNQSLQDFCNQSRPTYVVELQKDGVRYQGWKLDGKKHGHGKLFFPDKEMYQGQFREGHICGQGLIQSDEKIIGNRARLKKLSEKEVSRSQKENMRMV